MKRLLVNKRKQVGVTLIELALAMIIMSITVMTMSSFLSSSTKAYSVVENSVENYDKLSYAMERIAYELKTMKHDGSRFLINGTPSATGVDFDNNESTTNTINFSYAGTTLTLSYSQPVSVTSTLVDNVSAFTLTYYDQNAAAITDLVANASQIEFIEFDLTLTDDGVDYHSKSRVALRKF